MSNAEKGVRNSSVDMSRIEKALKAEIPFDDLTDAEAAIWQSQFDEHMRNPDKDPKVRAAYAKLGDEAKKVGYSEN